MQTEPIDLGSLEPIVIPFVIDKEDYVLREASADAKRRYRNIVMKSVSGNLAEGQIQAIDGINDAETVLVAGCLFKMVRSDKDPSIKKPQPVAIDTIRGWPDRIVAKLFDEAMIISGFKKGPVKAEDQDSPKVTPGLTPGSSDSPTDSESTSTS